MVKQGDPCQTCLFFNQESTYCAAYEMRAEFARRNRMLCGLAADQYVPRAPQWEFIHSWKFLTLIGAVVLIVAGLKFLGVLV